MQRTKTMSGLCFGIEYLGKQVVLMAKTCPRCQTVNDDAAAVCYACNTPFSAPAAYTPPAYQPQAPGQPYPQQPYNAYAQAPGQPYPQQPYAPQPYGQQPYGQYPQAPAAVPKKKSKAALFIILGIVVIVGIALALVIPRFVGQTLSDIANAATFELDGESIPSLKAVGGQGKLTSFTTGTRSGGKYNEYIYSLDSGQGQEVKEYMSHLVKSEGFIWITDVESFDVPTQKGVQCAKESRDDGYVLIVDASWDSKGYIITFVKIQGTLTVNETPITDPDDKDKQDKKDDKDDKDDKKNDPGDDPAFIKLLKSGRFYYEVTYYNIETGEEQSHGYDAQTATKSCFCIMFGSTIWRSILDTEAGKYYDVYDDSEEYTEYDATGVKVYDYNKWKATGTGTEQLLGETLQYIDYDVPNSGFRRAYLKNGDVCATVMYDEDGKRSSMVMFISNPSNNPPSSCFEIPSNYKKTS